jgi:UDPglucose 6-dehydrogenase
MNLRAALERGARGESLEIKFLIEEFNVGVVGAGYVGLTTGACLAHLGHRVTCVDNDEERIALLEEGPAPIYEPGLEELLTGGARRGRLRFSTVLSEIVHGADVLTQDRSAV